MPDPEIVSIRIDNIPGSEWEYTVGSSRVTRIVKSIKCGMHADIPYIEVWAGDHLLAEFCQHGIVGVYFAVPPPE
jgi:hypothetical protein